MKNKILGFAYRYSKSLKLVETYTVLYNEGVFFYRQLKKYEKVSDEIIIEELEKSGFKNMSYWNNYITDIIRDNECKEVSKKWKK